MYFRKVADFHNYASSKKKFPFFLKINKYLVTLKKLGTSYTICMDLESRSRPATPLEIQIIKFPL